MYTTGVFESLEEVALTMREQLCKHEEDVVCALYFVHLARATYVILIIIHIQIFVWKQGITIFLYLQAFKIYIKSEGSGHLMELLVSLVQFSKPVGKPLLVASQILWDLKIHFDILQLV